MTHDELDKKLFELCRPEAVTVSSINDFGGMWIGDRRWSPSREWSDLAPLIEAACKETACFTAAYAENGWAVTFISTVKANANGEAPTLPEAAALALVALLENEK